MYGGQERTTKYAEYAKVEAGRIVVEIKAVKRLTNEHRAQVINYLKATGKPLGLLINFGYYPKIEHQRFVNQPFSRLSRFS
jgi:GxxExxY protein